MARSIYITSPEGNTGKSSIALGLVELFARRVKVGVFRPIARSESEQDAILSFLLTHDGVDLNYEDTIGVTYEQVHRNPDTALSTIMTKYRRMEQHCDIVVIVGTDYTDIVGPTELAYNARIAANLGSAVILVLSAEQRSGIEVRQVADIAIAELRAAHAEVVAVIANRTEIDEREQILAALANIGAATWAIPHVPLLCAPSVRDLMAAVDGELVSGDEALLDREAENLVVAAMSMEHVLERTGNGTVAIVPGDRSEVILAMVAAHVADNFPSLAGLILNGGYLPSPRVKELAASLNPRLPVITTSYGTFETATRVAHTRGLLATGSSRKLDIARQLFEEYVDAEQLLQTVDLPQSEVVTPLMFEYNLIERARSQRKHIVLPEGDDDRILCAASQLLTRDVVDLTILGEEQAVRGRAAELGLDIDAATVLSPYNEALREQFAVEYTRLRAHRGMTVDRAREIVVDVSYFGTLMVHLGMADGMVSGAAHTTAHTIKPSFEIIKTVPGVSIVSSVFFMCLKDRVLVYGDCAVNPDPDAEELADIAISSAATAAQFGVVPRVAMLSYSTGTSGSGADVDKVRSATDTVRQRTQTLVVEGPIQYDAAVDAAVARAKLPDSQVAGRATVLIFPDLNTGNNTYKAVQRSAGAVAIGPVLQGLRKPVNDLSRGALVQDIVNTVAITAIQAQGDEA
ncbi:MAG: phosphate acetyltransferase [Parahaliea sp.]